MSEQTRYRLTGAVFLAALAIILAPMLFDGDGLPDVDVERLSASVPMDPVQAPSDAFAQETFDQVVQATDQFRQSADAQGFRADNSTRLGELSLANPDSGAAAGSSIWAVQVASFTEERNAIGLRDELREAGYEGFLSAIKRDDEIWTRVVIGPFLDAAEARRVASTVSSSFSVSAELRAVIQ